MIEAMNLALEVLIQLRTPLRVNTSLDAYDVCRAITSLRQAIAEAEKQEPKPCPTCEALARTVLMDQGGTA
jgi:hypothetical protein